MIAIPIATNPLSGCMLSYLCIAGPLCTKTWDQADWADIGFLDVTLRNMDVNNMNVSDLTDIAQLMEYVTHCSAFRIIAFMTINSSPPRTKWTRLRSDIFRCMLVTVFVFSLKFPWILFPRAYLTIINIGLANGMAPNRQQAIIWTNIKQVLLRIYAALERDEPIILYILRFLLSWLHRTNNL